MQAIVAILGGWRASLFALLAVLAVAACFFLRASEATSRLRADTAEQRAESLAGELRSTQAALKAEHDQAQRQAAIARQYEQDKADAQAAADRTIADLRAGNLRLRQRWQGCRVPGPAAAPGEPDGAAADREQGASDLVRAAAEADAQIRGLQALIRAGRK